jgi:hypothetical protein
MERTLFFILNKVEALIIGSTEMILGDLFWHSVENRL